MYLYLLSEAKTVTYCEVGCFLIRKACPVQEQADLRQGESASPTRIGKRLPSKTLQVMVSILCPNDDQSTPPSISNGVSHPTNISNIYSSTYLGIRCNSLSLQKNEPSIPYCQVQPTGLPQAACSHTYSLTATFSALRSFIFFP